LELRGRKWQVAGENCIMRSFITCTFSPHVIRVAGHVARMGDIRNTHKILIGKTERKRPLGRFRRRWVDNTEVNLR